MQSRARTDEAKDQRRMLLLEAALEEFYERGFAAARMSDIATRAGLSKGTLYLYFTSKEDLFLSLADVIAVPNVERLEAMLNAAPSIIHALQGIVQLAAVIIRQSDMPRLMKIMIADGSKFPALARTYRQKVIDRVLNAIGGALARAKEAGEIDIADPYLTARLVGAPVAMSAVWQMLFGDDPEAQVDLEALFALHGDMLAKALGVRMEVQP